MRSTTVVYDYFFSKLDVILNLRETAKNKVLLRANLPL